jgi:catechol 2,3-dioxygenase-like lactoylglutathione lyase family enzyme
MDLETLDHIGLVVSDVDRSIRWYQDVLGLERMYEAAWRDYPAVLVAGTSGVALFPPRGTPIQETGSLDGTVHIGFRTSRAGFEDAKRELAERGIEYRESDHKISWSIYLHDPDGYLIEITTYEIQDA